MFQRIVLAYSDSPESTGLGMGYSRVKFLKIGLAAWKAKGYPVEP